MIIKSNGASEYGSTSASTMYYADISKRAKSCLEKESYVQDPPKESSDHFSTQAREASLGRDELGDENSRSRVMKIPDHV